MKKTSKPARKDFVKAVFAAAIFAAAVLFAGYKIIFSEADGVVRAGKPFLGLVFLSAFALSIAGAALISRYMTKKYLSESKKSLTEIKDKLLREKKVRQEFFSNASHELKTPITSIKGYAELLESGMVEDEEIKKDIIRRIKKESERMSELIGDILEVSRLEAKDVKPELIEIDMSKLCADCINSFKVRAEKDGIKLFTEIEENVRIYADLSHMTELLDNLISNGIRYNRPSGSVRLSLLKEEGRVIIKVKDTGIGISKEDKEKIFNRFYRVDKGRSKMLGGTGLGLAIVKHVVEYYKGKISVNSTPGLGSEFTVELPNFTAL